MQIILVKNCSKNNGYDTFDSVVVVANDDQDAKRIHPSSKTFPDIYYDEDKKEFWSKYIDGKDYRFEDNWGSWTNDLDLLETYYIGEADPFYKRGVVLASFNAG